MIDAADISDSAPQDACGQAVRGRQLELLGALAEIGLEVARTIEREAKAPSPAPAAELALAYARTSRAVRLTIQLQTQVLDGPAARPPAPPAPAEAGPREVRRDRIVNIVERVAKDRHDDSDEVEELVYEASERLDDEDLYGDLMDHPVSEIVARICKDLGLRPDWKTLAEELWAKREMQDDQVGEPLKRFLPDAAGVPSLDAPRLPSSPRKHRPLGELGELGGDSFLASLPGAPALSASLSSGPPCGTRGPASLPPAGETVPPREPPPPA